MEFNLSETPITDPNQKIMKPHEVNYVIYHHPCLDGISSALVVKKFVKKFMGENEVIYKPRSIKSGPPNDLSGKNVLICDYSYKKKDMLKIIEQANKVLVIDHHKTAEKDLLEIDSKYKIFDMSHSGAVLTWNYFYPDVPTPLFLQYIEDHDIWKKELPNTDAFQSYLRTLPLEFSSFEHYLEDNYAVLDDIDKGIAYSQLNQFYIKDATKWVTPKFSRIGKKFYLVGYVNTSILKSEIGNEALKECPKLDFTAPYSINDKTNNTSFSLRSTNEHVDTSKIAGKFGGGGHRNASGVRFEYITHVLPGTVYDGADVYDLLDNVYFSNTLLKLDNENFSIYIVYLHTQNNKRRLGSYLLQTKYKVNNVRTQVGACLKTYPFENVHLDASVTWYYDPMKDKSSYVVTFDKKIGDNEKKCILENCQGPKITDFEYNGFNTCSFSISGLWKYIF
jgi:oligoribonuclease NrnB/cAMP/cGMP phosphodiesterase (DHH superfamily)